MRVVFKVPETKKLEFSQKVWWAYHELVSDSQRRKICKSYLHRPTVRGNGVELWGSRDIITDPKILNIIKNYIDPTNGTDSSQYVSDYNSWSEFPELAWDEPYQAKLSQVSDNYAKSVLMGMLEHIRNYPILFVKYDPNPSTRILIKELLRDAQVYLRDHPDGGAVDYVIYLIALEAVDRLSYVEHKRLEDLINAYAKNYHSFATVLNNTP